MTPNGSATPIHRYEIDMTKLLHGVIVSDDFTTFMHVSTPSNVVRDLASSGRSTKAGPYTVTLNRLNLSTHGETMLLLHVLRHGKPARDLHPYLGTLGHGVFLNAKDLTYVHVHPMALGAGHPGSVMSHSAMMPSGNGMDMHASPLPPSAVTSPNMLLHVAVREPGTYKLWFQFRGGDALRVASFVLTAT